MNKGIEHILYIESKIKKLEEHNKCKDKKKNILIDLKQQIETIKRQYSPS